MNLQFQDDRIPGTKLKQSDMEGATGLAFLKKVFLISDGVMMTQIREISGIDSSTLQNWTKRGWVLPRCGNRTGCVVLSLAQNLPRTHGVAPHRAGNARACRSDHRKRGSLAHHGTREYDVDRKAALSCRLHRRVKNL